MDSNSTVGQLSALREAADRAYCDYIDQMRKPECLGYEQKLKEGSFGKAELDAHVRAGELLGRHRALSEAVQALAVPQSEPSEQVRKRFWDREYQAQEMPPAAPKPAPATEPNESIGLLVRTLNDKSISPESTRLAGEVANAATKDVATIDYPCGCNAAGSGNLPLYCPTHNREAAPAPACEAPPSYDYIFPPGECSNPACGCHAENEIRTEAKQRVALAESIMKLPYIKAIRNAELGQERFVARDDVITAIHEHAKKVRALAASVPPPPYIQDHNAQFGFGIFVVTGEHQRTAFFTKEAAEQYLAQQHDPERFRIVVYPKPL